MSGRLSIPLATQHGYDVLRQALALLLAYWLAQEARQFVPGSTVHFSARDRPDEISFLACRLETTFAALQAVLEGAAPPARMAAIAVVLCGK